MKSIYYAHSMRIYNTQQEQLELNQIAELVPSRDRRFVNSDNHRILNPNGAIASIKEAYRLIDKSSGVVATEYQAHLGKGVYDEICYGLSQKKFVAVLRSGRLFRVYSEHQIEVLDIDWQVHYARVYEGFYIPPLKERLTVERIKAGKLNPGGILDEIADTTKEFLIRLGRMQVLAELFGERMK